MARKREACLDGRSVTLPEGLRSVTKLSVRRATQPPLPPLGRNERAVLIWNCAKP
jgi:hypothetical protein